MYVCMYVFIYLFILVVPEFELRAEFAFARQVLYHLSHASEIAFK
jgi:hypothetical protein